METMKIGIVLRGITSGESPTQKKDWTLCKDNIKDNLIGSFDNPRVYFTTYQNDVLPDVVDFYKPISIQLVDYNTSDQRKTLFYSLNQVANEDLDFIIIGRFDIQFKQKITTLNIDYTKFNFIFRETEPYWSGHRYVSDTFFAFPKVFLPYFMEAVKREIEHPERPYSDMHNAYKQLEPLIGNENIHFMVDGTHRSDVNPWFEIKRIPK